MNKVNLADKFRLVSDYWNPKIAAELNDSYIKLAKFKGAFIWHRHETEDELFLVVKGALTIRLRDGEIRLEPGEFIVVPCGIEHMPIADGEAHVVLIEPKTTLNTGDKKDERTVTDLERV